MDLKLINDSGKPAATLTASDALFAREYNEALIHQIVTAFQANARSGNRAQKSRGEINKSHKKPWQQKGTGRARAGQANSPLWRGGGKIFPSSPDENFSQKVNRKMYRAGIASILSQLVRAPCPSAPTASCATCSLGRATSAPCYRCAHSPGTL
jgi:large subunit ribosomal protein L4